MSDSIKKWHEMQEEKAFRIKDAVVTIDTPMIHESPDGGKTVRSRPFREGPKKDRFVQQIKEKFEQRSQTGIKKYGTTLERDDLSLQDWLTHFEEELMDGLLYLQVLKDKLK